MFRGSITRPARSLCTLRSVDCSTTTQHTVPAGGQPWPGGIGYPQGPAERFPSDVLHPSSSFPRLRLAQANQLPLTIVERLAEQDEERVVRVAREQLRAGRPV